MNLNSKKPEKRPLYVYYIIAVVIIVLLNVFALPALSERSVKETDIVICMLLIFFLL